MDGLATQCGMVGGSDVVRLKFTGTQDEFNWAAGYFTIHTANKTVAQTDPSSFSTANMSWSGSNWLGNQQFNTPFLTEDGGWHPGGPVPHRSAVARYTVQEAGNVIISVDARITGGGSTSLAFWHNNTNVLSYVDLTSSLVTYQSTGFSVSPGDYIYVELNPNGTYTSDSSQLLNVTISPS